MPIPSLVSAIVSSIVGSAIDEISAAGSAPQPVPMAIVSPARTVPADALRGEMVVVGPMNAEINGQAIALSPGIQIRNEANLIIMPSTLQQPTRVRYLTDPTGSVSRVWILSAQEAAQ